MDWKKPGQVRFLDREIYGVIYKIIAEHPGTGMSHKRHTGPCNIFFPLYLLAVAVECRINVK